MITTIAIAVLGMLLVFISGMFDFQKDYSTIQAIRKYIDEELYSHYPFYFFTGVGEMSGWVFKWKNGDNKQGEAYKGSTTYKVYQTDWKHFVKRWNIIFMVSGCICLAYVHPFLIIIYETINHFGFQFMKKQSKLAVKFMLFFQKRGIAIFLKNQDKYNRDLLNEYLTKPINH